ncbi:MAG: hypothetical protein ACYCU0_10650 [Solirubrobacteraceae bacterium]
MTAIVPSYLAKLTRAKEHLIDLAKAVDAYGSTHPYTVRKRIEGKKQMPVWRLEFTSSPANTDIPIITADAVYNLRASLDHLMNAIVAKKDRGKAMFPIFFDGVWEAIIPGENQERIKQRMRWASDIKTLPNEAVTILKGLQPADTAAHDPQTSYLRLVNRLSNRDRHEKLPVVGVGLAHHRVLITNRDGEVVEVPGSDPDRALQHQASLRFPNPEDVVDVKVQGTPLVAVPAQIDKRYIEIPLRLTEALVFIENRVIGPLTPFVLPDAA